MNHHDSSSFRFGIDDDRPDSIFREETPNPQIKKINQRITLVSLLIPCLVGLVLLLAYMDITKRFGNQKNAETLALTELSKYLESRFSSLSVQYAKLQDQFSKKVSPMDEVILEFEKFTSANKKGIELVAKNLENMNALKTDKKEFEAALNKLEKALEPLQKDLKDIEAQVKTLAGKISPKLDTISAKVEKGTIEQARLAKSIESAMEEIDELQSSVSALTKNKIEKKDLDLALRMDQLKLKSYEQQLNRTTQDLEEKIKSIQDQVSDGNKKPATPVRKSSVNAPRKLSDAPDSIKSLQERESKKEILILTPGKIIEQDIR
ncbi:MAG: hypothetical protein Q8P24_03470 [Desulfobacterales bacterium]|nr:hypothetical protein [Desulfobacterales bacterium]